MKITNEHKLYMEFSIGCAIQVLPIYEKKYPANDKPRKALEAAKAFLNSPTKKNADAAYAAAYAVYAADAAAYAAADAAYAAAYAAYAVYAADAADDAVYAADAAADAAYAVYAADAAADAVYAAADAERLYQVKLLAFLNFKYNLSIKIRGVK